MNFLEDSQEPDRTSETLPPTPPKAAHLIADFILEKKGEDLVVLDISSTAGHLADYVIIATARGQRQVQAMSEELMKHAKGAGIRRLSESGRSHGWWVLLDFGDVLVHIMQPEARRFYDLDALWADATTVRRGVDADI